MKKTILALGLIGVLAASCDKRSIEEDFTPITITGEYGNTQLADNVTTDIRSTDWNYRLTFDAEYGLSYDVLIHFCCRDQEQIHFAQRITKGTRMYADTNELIELDSSKNPGMGLMNSSDLRFQ